MYIISHLRWKNGADIGQQFLRDDFAAAIVKGVEHAKYLDGNVDEKQVEDCLENENRWDHPDDEWSIVIGKAEEN